MLAIIMAGGEGARLRPLTCDRPKPMAPLVGKPVMEYTLSLLKSHHVDRAAVTLKYLPEHVRSYFGDGKSFGVELTYFIEDAPLGTAGGVGQARDFLTDTFCVLSGDGLTDCDLTEALASHKASGAEATIVVRPMDNPLEYGVVCVDQGGFITRFVEKPEWSQVVSDLVNTGIYILEPSVLSRIPAGKCMDFGMDLFPAMLREGARLHAFRWNGYWCDIGDMSAYRQANFDLLDGKVCLPGAPKSGAIRRMPGSRVSPDAYLEGPCHIAEDAFVGDGAHISAYTVLGKGSRVMPGSSIKKSILWEGALVEAGCEVRGSVLMAGSRMESSSRAFEGSVLGGGSTLGEGSTLRPEAKIWPGKRIPADMTVSGSLVWGGGEGASFSQGALRIQNPEDAYRAAQAWCSVLRPEAVLLARDVSAASQACFLAAMSALLSQGAQVYDAGRCTLSEARMALWNFGCDGAAHISFEKGIRLWDRRGAELSGEKRRSLLSRMRRGDADPPFSRLMRPPIRAGRCDLAYLGRVCQDTPHIQNACVAVYCADSQTLNLAERAFEKAGCQVRAEWEEEMMTIAPGEIGVWLEEGGETVRFLDEQGALSEWENQLVPLWIQLMDGSRRLLIPQHATRAAEDLSERFQAETIRSCGERSQWMNALLEHSRQAFCLHFDGIFLALQFIDHLRASQMTLQAWRDDLPKIYRKSRIVRIDPRQRGRSMRALLESPQGAGLDAALSCRGENSWAWICPSDTRGECRVVTEARQWETASELCDLYCAALSAPPESFT